MDVPLTDLIRIKQIRPGMRNLVIVGEIAEMGEVRSVTTKFGPARVSTAILRDETGWVKLNLWRDQIEKVKLGDTIKLENAFAREFGSWTELNIGSDGKITVLARKS